MKYVVMDATDLKYPDESFDLVFDKSTIDTLQCSNSPLVSTGKMIK
jgi:ubiquinone/menaquinone biosynthesis C-methylase UbiE